MATIAPAILNLHNLMVPLILTAGGLTLIGGIVLLVMRRGVADTDTPSSSAAPLVARLYRILLWVTAGLGALQAVFGGLLYLAGERPGEVLHYVYGGIVLLAIPVAYVYSDQKRVRRDLIIMVIALVAVIGAAVRALMTGAPH
ncbi:MAG TPA: hypothetical protein VF808_12135 [Ktedonobacterales bacterium]